MSNTENNIEQGDIKKIIIIDEPPKNRYSKKIFLEKEKKMRVETKTWGLNEEELSHQTQTNIIQC